MKAVTYTQYGAPDVLHLTEMAKPAPKDNEVLIRVHATPVNFGDAMARNFGNISPRQFNMPLPLYVLSRMAFGFSRPKKHVLGSEFAGVVEAVGKDVTRFTPGDRVFGYPGMNMGANAEYICMPQDGMLALKPTNMTHEEAAAVPYGALTALSLLRRMNIQPGQKVLINGASGAIGSYAVQLARFFGAHVTGVCSTERLDYVRSLGADQVIDYTKTDFTTSGETYDLVFDVLGKGAFQRWRRPLNPNGRYLLASFKMKHLVQMLITSVTGDKKVVCAFSGESPADLVYIKELIEAGHIKAVVDKRYPLEQAADAHRYFESGHKHGSVVIVMPA